MSSQQPQGNGGVILMVVAVGLVTFGLGWLVGNYNQAPDSSDRGDQAAAVGADTDRDSLGDSDQIPVGDSPILGNPEAPVTIVEFTSMQCPFCARGAETLDQVLDKYGDDVRVVFKHFPLGMQDQARPASKIMEAARLQDEEAFWTAKDEIFERIDEFRGYSDDEMEDMGAEIVADLGLDADQFREDFNDDSLGDIIDSDMALGRDQGVSGTPAFRINGVEVTGAQPLESFSEIIDEQLELAGELKEDGIADDELYAAAVRHNLDVDDGADEPEEAERPERPEPSVEADLSEGIPAGDSPIMGNPDAPVTVVEFTSMQCPFCARGADTLEQLVDRFDGDVRVVFKHFPLAMQQQAEPASRLLEAARRQDDDIFWDMKSALFDRLDDYGSDMEGLGAEIGEDLGLDPDQLIEDFNDPALAEIVEADQALGSQLGVRGTPHFFVNGEVVNGAQPLPQFAEVVERQLELLEELEADGVDEDELYAAAVQHNLGGDDDPEPQREREQPEQDDSFDTDKLAVGDSYIKGDEDAPVTIYEFSSFQCPFCARARDTTERILEEYEGDVRLVYKNFPLGMQEHSEPASRAAVAAGEQGSFWEMYDKIYDNQSRLGEDGLFEELAREIGLNIDRFNQDYESDAVAQQVREEQSMGQDLGVRGTPHFFVNDESLRGAQPFEEFQSVIEAELGN